MANYTVEEMAKGIRWFVNFTEKNAIGETLVVEVSKCENSGGKNSLPYLWKKNGYTKTELQTYWSISTYVTDTEGLCRGAYNPTIKRSEDGKRSVINFDWMEEATPEHIEKIVKEVYRLFMAATGITATEEKHNKVREHGKKYNIDIVETMPEGFFESSCATDPRGAVSIINKKWSLEALHDGTYQRKLLLV